MDDNYKSKAVVLKMTASSRVAIKIRENFYTVEYTEERAFPESVDMNEIDIEKERGILFDDVNAVVDDQAQQILKSFK